MDSGGARLHGASIGVTTDSTVQHSMYALLISTVCTAAMSFVLSMAQGLTRLMAGGIIHAKMSTPEDRDNFAGPTYEEIARKGPTFEQLHQMKTHTKRVKLANRMHNIAQEAHDTTAISLILFWAAFLSCTHSRYYCEKIAQLSIAFVVGRCLFVFHYLIGINFKFVPLRSPSIPAHTNTPQIHRAHASRPWLALAPEMTIVNIAVFTMGPITSGLFSG